jgi:3-oxoacyl-[acyl-carrier protein] reductase
VHRTVEAFGGIDILINNAARHLRQFNQPLSKLTSEQTRELFDVNVMGVIYCSLAARETMRERGGGVIVNLSSTAGHRVQTAYGVTKLAVRGLTSAFAHDFADDRIRVNAISPGLMASDNALADYGDAHFEQSIKVHQLIRRKGLVDDIVNTMLYLVSDASSFVTGETLVVNGGRDLYI